MSAFGRFLVSQNKITEAQLNKAVKWQRNMQKPLIYIALEQNMIPLKKGIAILKRQSGMRMEKCWAALEQGCLTAEQIGRLIEVQAAARPKIGDVLVEMGAIDRTTLSEMRYIFVKNCAHRSEENGAVNEVLNEDSFEQELCSG